MTAKKTVRVDVVGFEDTPICDEYNHGDYIGDQASSIGQSWSLPGIGIAPVEKLFGITSLHAKADQTMSGILEAMEVDQAMRIVHATRIVRKRKFADGEIVGSVFGDVTQSLPWEPLLHAEAFLEFVASPVAIQRQGRDRHTHHQIGDALWISV